ncbi:HNH endonuclease [Moorena sp. SIO4E2]|uniref:HNH endonuclease signature motif containing protein n=1 Tax=Moorena sp. SIO4E2 TaxID=2607826 RepID=UPI00338FDB70
MDGSRNSLWFTKLEVNRRFRKEKKVNRYTAKKLSDQAFPSVKYKENKHIKVRVTKSPYDGDLVYWSQRNSGLYDNATSKALKKQNHCCGHCGHKLLGNEYLHLHHIDGNHDNWKPKNLMAVHQSCHQQIHSSQKDT